MKNITYNLATGETFETDITEEQIAEMTARGWQVFREERNRRLAESDWTVLSDTPTSTAAWKTYRQALRDLPANTTDPFNPEWPVAPA